jgi:hypothetical protein
MFYIWMDVDAIVVFVCVDVGTQGLEVELVRVSARWGLVRSSHGEKCRSHEAGARPTDDMRVGRRHRFDDPGAGPSHAPLVEADEVLEDFHCQLEVVLQGVPEGMWTQTQD